jgi:hypothetical protein
MVPLFLVCALFRNADFKTDGQRDRAELEHGIVERADVEFETRSSPTRSSLPSRLLP